MAPHTIMSRNREAGFVSLIKLHQGSNGRLWCGTEICFLGTRQYSENVQKERAMFCDYSSPARCVPSNLAFSCRFDMDEY